MTQQVARIDAHLLNRSGVTRLCYCGPVLHTRPDRPRATREPLQFGAEIYGHSGMEADLESVLLALDCLHLAGVEGVSVDLSDARVVRTLLEPIAADSATVRRIYAALAAKDASELSQASAGLPSGTRRALSAVLELYGDASVLDEARTALSDVAGVEEVLANLKSIAAHLEGPHGVVRPRRSARLFLLQRRPLHHLRPQRDRCRRAGGATTKWGRPSAGPGRPRASASTSSNWSALFPTDAESGDQGPLGCHAGRPSLHCTTPQRG